MKSRLATLFVFAAACAGPAAPPPATPPPAPLAAPAPELSTIVVPIRASLAPIASEVEARVAKTFADSITERGFNVRYDVAREPIKLAMIGAGLHATTKVRYALEACRGRFPCISCGFGEPRREADIALHTKLDWDPSWRIRSTTTPLPVHYPKRCEVTWFDFDITNRYVAPVVDQQLAMAARTIDRGTPSLANLKPQAQQIWSALQTPTELAPRTWLVLEPVDVALSPLAGSGSIITSTLALQARTRVVVGAKPPTGTKPLPALRVANVNASGMRVPFDLELPYDEANRLASAEFARKKYKVGGRDLAVEAVRIAPAAGGKLLVEASIVHPRYRGVVLLEGTPRFDAATSSLIVPDLDYQLAARSRNPFFRLAERAAHDTLRDRLRENARFPLASRIATIQSEITRALTRPLGKGVTLQGRADSVQPLSVTPLDAAIVIRVVVTGAAEVTL